MEIINTRSYIVYPLVEEDLKAGALWEPGEPKKAAGTYYRASILPENPKTASFLCSRGFFFADRTIMFELPLGRMDEKQKRMIRFESRCSGEFGQEIYQLAREAFVRDRRFHLKRDYDQEMAAEIVSAYLDSLKENGCFAVTAYHKEKLIGFNIFKLWEGREDALPAAENMLGAVCMQYQRTGAAVSLYLSAAAYLAERGVLKLSGRISAANLASLNLHLMLGNGHTVLKNPLDIYLC